MRFVTSDSYGDDEELRYGGMVCLEGGNLHVIPFEQMRDPVSGRTRVRYVDMQSEHYRVARQYMIRLNRSDMNDADMVKKLAEAARHDAGSVCSRVQRRGGGAGGVGGGGGVGANKGRCGWVEVIRGITCKGVSVKDTLN